MKGKPLFKQASGILKSSVHQIANKAWRKGDLQPKPCEVCGRENVLAHHEDYSKPLGVNWLCPQHHADRHKVLRLIHEIEIDNSWRPKRRKPISKTESESRRLKKLLTVLQILLTFRFGSKATSSIGEHTILIGTDRIDMNDGECNIIARGPARIATVLVRRRRKK